MRPFQGFHVDQRKTQPKYKSNFQSRWYWRCRNRSRLYESLKNTRRPVYVLHSLIKKIDQKPIESVSLFNLRPVPTATENMQLRSLDKLD